MRGVITHGESHIALAATRCLGRNNIGTLVISEDKRAVTFSSKYCASGIVSSYSDDELFSCLSAGDVVMPIDEDIMLRLLQSPEKTEYILPYPQERTLRKVLDKGEMMAHSRAHGIPCPKTAGIDHPDEVGRYDWCRFPLVIKPTRGEGGRGVMIARDAREFYDRFPELQRQYGPLIVQEKIPFTEKYTVGVLCDRDSHILSTCILKELRNYPIENGPACAVMSVRHPEILASVTRLIPSLRYYGVANLDYVIDKRDNTPKLLEINPRFWGSLQGAISSGVDFPALLFELAVTGDISEAPTCREGILCRNIVIGDLMHLHGILTGNYPLRRKKIALLDFLAFHKNIAHYIFSPDDIRPSMTYIKNKLRYLLHSLYPSKKNGSGKNPVHDDYSRKDR